MLTQTEVLQRLVQEFNARQPDKTVFAEVLDGQLFICGVRHHVALSPLMKKVTPGRRFSRKVDSGRWNLVVGRYRDHTRFQIRPDGSAKWDDISRRIKYAFEQDAWQRRVTETREANTDASRQFNIKHGLHTYGDIRAHASADADKPIELEIKVRPIVTVEQGDRIIAALRSVGLLGEQS